MNVTDHSIQIIINVLGAGKWQFLLFNYCLSCLGLGRSSGSIRGIIIPLLDEELPVFTHVCLNVQWKPSIGVVKLAAAHICWLWKIPLWDKNIYIAYYFIILIIYLLVCQCAWICILDGCTCLRTGMAWMMLAGRCSLEQCHPCLLALSPELSAPGCPFGFARSLCPDWNIYLYTWADKMCDKLTDWLSIPQFKARIGGRVEIFLDCFVGWYLLQTSHQAGVTCSGLRLLVRTSQNGTSVLPVKASTIKILQYLWIFIDLGSCLGRWGSIKTELTLSWPHAGTSGICEC